MSQEPAAGLPSEDSVSGTTDEENGVGDSSPFPKKRASRLAATWRWFLARLEGSHSIIVYRHEHLASSEPPIANSSQGNSCGSPVCEDRTL